MLKLSQIVVRSSINTGRLPSLVWFNNFSSASTAELKNVQSNSADSILEEANAKGTHTTFKPIVHSKTQNSMVAAAFASLHSDQNSVVIKTPITDEKIVKANTVDELLSISGGSGVSRRHALKVVSVLADWSTSGKVKLSDFETDPRFVRLCRVLTKGTINGKNKNSVASRSEDLSTILSVTADDEAAKLVGSITLPQMVKVMSTLAQKKRRSTLLLRALSYNITGNSEQLDLKQSGDLLYSMSILNFPEENLLVKVANDVCVELEKDIKKSAVVGSVITSLGLLKYKNSGLLDTLSEWVLKNHSICRPQDIFSLFMTLAVLNYTPANSEKLFEVIVPQLTSSEAGKPLIWLEIVWSLVLLNQANAGHVSSVLSADFIETLEIQPLTTSSKLKLLNIDAAAQYLIKGYNGPRISSPIIRNTKISQTKDKTEMVDSVVDSLKNLIQSDSHLRTRINTGLGFFIDAECLLDKKCNPLSLSQTDSKSEATRVAILAYDYHDMSRGRVEPIGINIFATRLLEAQGYKVLTVPYTEFKPRDKLVHRVQYLETKLKEVVKS